MDLNELNDIFTGDNFYYRNNYFGVIKGISYDNDSEYYTIHFLIILNHVMFLINICWNIIKKN